MVNKLLSKSKELLTGPQVSVLSAASIIMLMIIASRVLGLVRQRVLAHFFAPQELALFFAAFRLPDLVFEVLVFGTFSSAFIPVFTKALDKGKEEAWDVAATVVNIGLSVFILLALIVGLGANPLYSLFAPGFSGMERDTIVQLTRILFAAQGFFVVSYVLTGVLESLRRFLVPALAPLFYNLGIIGGTIFLSEPFGLMGPVIGVVAGAFAHFAIQLPLAFKLGFRFHSSWKVTDNVRKIGKLALPRVVEVSFLQLSKLAELYFSSLISTASYAYYTFGNTLQLLPVGLFGTSIAKAALPTLARESDDPKAFSKTLFSALNQLIFLALPIATILIVLRVPVVRLVYGTDIFSWNATLETGYVLSAFAVGVVFQAGIALLARSFYALHDTKTPVKISIIAILLTVILDFVFIRILGLSVWGLALAFTIGAAFQAISLFLLINRKIVKRPLTELLNPILKLVFAAFSSGVVMFFLLKIFDRSVWVKRLSFLGRLESTRYFPFERFVLDTRYTINVLALTVLVSLVGLIVYILVALLLQSAEVLVFFNLVKRLFTKRKGVSIPEKEQEPIAPTPTETAS